jgi:hypothetical protein
MRSVLVILSLSFGVLLISAAFADSRSVKELPSLEFVSDLSGADESPELLSAFEVAIPVGAVMTSNVPDHSATYRIVATQAGEPERFCPVNFYRY